MSLYHLYMCICRFLLIHMSVSVKCVVLCILICVIYVRRMCTGILLVFVCAGGTSTEDRPWC